MIKAIHKIADYYGYEAQSRQLIEEMAMNEPIIDMFDEVE